MDHTYWHKQTADKPLFPDLLWSRPENRRQAGKLYIIGGNAMGFAAAASAYSAATQAGIGTARVLLPDSLAKTVSKLFPEAEYAPSTPSGSFSQAALGVLLEGSAWSDGVLLAGDFGKNSETAVILEQALQKYSGQLTMVGDGLDYFLQQPALLLSRQQSVLVPSFAQLQKLASASGFPIALTSTMDFLQLVKALHDFSIQNKAAVVLTHIDTTFIAVSGQVSTTKPVVRSGIDLAAHAAVWWLQNPSQPFAALSSAAIKTNS